MLGGGVAVSAVLAWQFTGARLGPPAGADAASRSSATAALIPDALPSAAYGNTWASPSPATSVTAVATTAAAAPSASATTQPSATAERKPTPSPRASSSATTTPPALAKVARCAPADIVLSMVPAQTAYASGTQPRFEVFAVSTAAAQCELPFGPGSVRVIVTRHGHVVWDSAACAAAAAPTVRFTRGVPQVLTISWNRAAKHPAGCAGSLSPGEWGTFYAVAVSGGEVSHVRSFKLLR